MPCTFFCPLISPIPCTSITQPINQHLTNGTIDTFEVGTARKKRYLFTHQSPFAFTRLSLVRMTERIEWRKCVN